MLQNTETKSRQQNRMETKWTASVKIESYDGTK